MHHFTWILLFVLLTACSARSKPVKPVDAQSAKLKEVILDQDIASCWIGHCFVRYTLSNIDTSKVITAIVLDGGDSMKVKRYVTEDKCLDLWYEVEGGKDQSLSIIKRHHPRLFKFNTMLLLSPDSNFLVKMDETIKFRYFLNSEEVMENDSASFHYSMPPPPPVKFKQD